MIMTLIFPVARWLEGTAQLSILNELKRVRMLGLLY